MKSSQKPSANDVAVKEMNDDIAVLYDSFISGAEPRNVGTADIIMNKSDEKKVDTRVDGDKGNCERCCRGINV